MYRLHNDSHLIHFVCIYFYPYFADRRPQPSASISNPLAQTSVNVPNDSMYDV